VVFFDKLYKKTGKFKQRENTTTLTELEILLVLDWDKLEKLDELVR